jgi:hypothetical protein
MAMCDTGAEAEIAHVKEGGVLRRGYLNELARKKNLIHFPPAVSP